MIDFVVCKNKIKKGRKLIHKNEDIKYMKLMFVLTVK